MEVAILQDVVELAQVLVIQAVIVYVLIHVEHIARENVPDALAHVVPDVTHRAPEIVRVVQLLPIMVTVVTVTHVIQRARHRVRIAEVATVTTHVLRVALAE